MNKKISTFIFDCFGVICDPVLYTWYGKHSSKHGFTDSDLPDVLREFDLGIRSEDDLIDYFLKYKGVTLTREKLREDIDSYLRIDQNIVRIIKKLKEKGYKTVLLSNGNHSFFERKIYKVFPEFKSLFDEILISSLVGMVKPDGEIFLYALRQIQSKPEEALFIDDNPSNVQAATALGMQGFVYTGISSFEDYLTHAIGINFK